MSENKRRVCGLMLIVGCLSVVAGCAGAPQQSSPPQTAQVATNPQQVPASTQRSPQEATFYRWNDIPEEPLNPTLSRKIITADRMMMAHVILKKGSVVPTHQHENEQITYILKGALKFEINGKEIIVREGEVLTVPSNVPHAATALEDTLDLDVFSPPRQDWLNKTDNYLRGK